VELAFLEFDIEAMILEFLEDLADMLNVFFERVRVNEDVVEIDNNE